MPKIKSKILNQDDQGWQFEVEIEDGGSKSSHKVMLSQDYYNQLTSGEKIEAQALIEKSIEFLLEREDKESILPEFDLRIIANYFPEYEDEIKFRF